MRARPRHWDHHKLMRLLFKQLVYEALDLVHRKTDDQSIRPDMQLDAKIWTEDDYIITTYYQTDRQAIMKMLSYTPSDDDLDLLLFNIAKYKKVTTIPIEITRDTTSTIGRALVDCLDIDPDFCVCTNCVPREEEPHPFTYNHRNESVRSRIIELLYDDQLEMDVPLFGVSSTSDKITIYTTTEHQREALM
jgi:hypothetical protein